eukprot:scaffold247173_cov17-Tisochrysis_lutea.AAC.1
MQQFACNTVLRLNTCRAAPGSQGDLDTHALFTCRCIPWTHERDADHAPKPWPLKNPQPHLRTCVTASASAAAILSSSADPAA